MPIIIIVHALANWGKGGGKALRPRETNGGDKLEALRSGPDEMEAVLGRRCCAMTGTRGERKDIFVEGVLGVRCCATRVHYRRSKRDGLRRSGERPNWAPRRRGGVMSTSVMWGMLGVRPSGHAGIGGRRPQGYMSGAARRLTFCHAGGTGSIVRGTRLPQRVWSDTTRDKLRGFISGRGWRRGRNLSSDWRSKRREKRPVEDKNEGEASNPGPSSEVLVLAGANVTSWRKRWPIAQQWPYDIVCLQETMLGEQAQREMEAIMSASSWGVRWGSPQPLKNKPRAGNDEGLNVYDACNGGVAVAFKNTNVVEKVPQEPDFDYLFDEGRLVHCYAPVGTGSSGLHCFSLYGYASATTADERKRLNRTLYNGAIRCARGVGRVPVFIFGDFNPNPGEADLVEEAIAGTEWTDILSAWAGAPEEAENTFLRSGPFPGMKVKGATRPDRVLANREALALVRMAWVDFGRDNGPHAPLVVELNVEAFRATFRTLTLPKPWDYGTVIKNLGDMTTEEKKSLEEEFLGDRQRREIDTVLAEGKISDALLIWAAGAEGYTARAAGVAQRDLKKHTGRSKEVRFREASATAEIQRSKAAQGETSHELILLAKLERRVLELEAKMKRRMRCVEQGTLYPSAEADAVEKLISKTKSVLALTELEPCQDYTSLSVLEALRKKVVAREKQQRVKERRDRRKQQIELLELDWVQGHGRANYKRARAPPPPPTLVLSRPGGTVTANPSEMMDLVRDAWVKPIFSKHGRKTQEEQRQDWLAFADFCGEALQVVPGASPEHTWERLHSVSEWGGSMENSSAPRLSPVGHGGGRSEALEPSWASSLGHAARGDEGDTARFPLPPLSGQRLKEKASLMAGKATGPDGWAARDLLLLPGVFWEVLAQILQENENFRGRFWPPSLLLAIISLIPKGEGMEPINQRPITVFSVLYRLYSAHRFEDTEPWQESWLPEEVCGARAGREALDATWEMALEIEEAYLDLQCLLAALLDNSKFFDFCCQARGLAHPAAPGGACEAHPVDDAFLRGCQTFFQARKALWRHFLPRKWTWTGMLLVYALGQCHWGGMGPQNEVRKP